MGYEYISALTYDLLLLLQTYKHGDRNTSNP